MKNISCCYYVIVQLCYWLILFILYILNYKQIKNFYFMQKLFITKILYRLQFYFFISYIIIMNNLFHIVRKKQKDEAQKNLEDL